MSMRKTATVRFEPLRRVSSASQFVEPVNAETTFIEPGAHDARSLPRVSGE
jgi:hypothetical protein